MKPDEIRLLKDIINNPEKELDEIINNSSLFKTAKKTDVLYLIKAVSILKSDENIEELKNLVEEMINSTQNY